MNNFGEKVSFIWSVADLLRGPYKPAQYGKVILPLTVLRRLDCVLEPTKAEVLRKYEAMKGGEVKNLEPILNHAAGQAFHNTSRLDFARLKDDPANIAPNLAHYIASFSSRAREIIEYFGFEAEIEKLDKANRLYLAVAKFCEIDLHPDVVPNVEMGYIFEELVRKFSEAANETAGDHFTPREVIRLMVNLLFEPDAEVLTKPGIVRTVYDPACGTGGMLSVSEDYLRELNPQARLEAYGQEYNPESYAICGSDLMIKGQSLENIKFGDSFTADGLPAARFDYMLANPPFGGSERKEIQQNFPIRTGETAYLFLEHFIKMLKAGGRAGIVIKNTFLSNTDNASVSLRKLLLESCNLHTVLDCPSGTFQGAGVKTVVLFFEKGSPTKKVWYYKLDPGRNLGKTNPLNDDDLAVFVELQKTQTDTDRSWSVDVADIDQATFDLSVKNPNNGDEVAHRSPVEILDEIEKLDAESFEVLAKIRALL